MARPIYKITKILELIEKNHVKSTRWTPELCAECQELWPCDAVDLASAVRAYIATKPTHPTDRPEGQR